MCGGGLGNWGRSAGGGDRNFNAIVRMAARAEAGKGRSARPDRERATVGEDVTVLQH
jgi:hypothetical protein